MGLKSMLLLGVFSLIAVEGVIAQQKWQDITSVEDVCRSYPQEINKIFTSLDLDVTGLEKVKAAYSKGHVEEACQRLLDYYKYGNTANYLRVEQPLVTGDREALGDTILKNVFVIQGVRGQVPFEPDGHRNWNYRGPNNDVEWAWLSNRHPQIDSLFVIYLRTGNPDYAQYIDLFLRDFIIKSLPYPGKASATDIWRGLEVSFRAKVWPRIFYGLINSKYLSPATQLLMLSSLPDHAHYNRYFHKKSTNWLTMEISGLATIAAAFPEMKHSEEWLDYALATMGRSMKEQVYADGVQTELTSHYHNGTLISFEELKDICDRTGKEVPDFYRRTLEQMYGYTAHTMRPDGFGLLNNDSDRDNNRELVLKGAQTFGRPDWAYIATNGRSGVKPEDGPSYFYPWAGHFVSRSGYDINAHWSFFDMGPWGTAHEHSDKLHLSISAYGRDLLVDAGRFAYSGKLYRKFRAYAIGSAGHNVLLIDHKGQNPGPPSVSAPIADNHIKIDVDFDYASDHFSDFKVEGDVCHLRSLFYVRGEYWIVVDRVLTDRPRDISALWHWHPSCTVVNEGREVKTKNAFGNLAITPVSDQLVNVELINGQEQPVQGWYSSEYNKVEANTASCYSTTIIGDATLVWMLTPGGESIPDLSAQIVSETDTGVKVRVTSSDKTWVLNIPFNDSSQAEVVVK